MDEKKLKKLEELLNLADQDYVTPEELGVALEAVVTAFNKKGKEETAILDGLITGLKDSDNETHRRIDNTDADILKWAQKFQADLRNIELTPGKDGKDADVEELVRETLSRLKIPEPIVGKDGSPDTPEQVRNKLEQLDGDDRLDKSAIKGLDEWMKTNANAGVGGGLTRVVGANRFLYQLLDVNVSGITVNQSIKWNGLQWIPYTPSGGGGGGTVDSVVGGAGIDVDSTDPANPIVSLDTATIASLALADSSTQPGDGVSTLFNDAGYISTEEAQDAVGSILVDTTYIQLIYDDSAPSIRADIFVGTLTFSLMNPGVQSSLLLADSALQTVAVDGVTITGDGTVGNPLVATGSGGGFTVLTPTGAVDSSNLVFTFTAPPTYIIADGTWLPELDNNGNSMWSIAGNVVTMVNPPSFILLGVA